MLHRIAAAVLAILLASCQGASLAPTSSPQPTPSTATPAPTASPAPSASARPTGSVVPSPSEAVATSSPAITSPSATGTPAPTATRPAGLLTAAEMDGLKVALSVERRSFASYAQVIADLGEVRPFVNVLAAEQTHVDQVKALFLKYAAPIPADTSSGLERYSTVASACVAAAQNERQLVATYDQLLGTTLRADIQTVYRSLQAASRDNHLPAFTRC